jgi:tRNA threonylcarbamoyladenosine biosynthesis protein TsaB
VVSSLALVVASNTRPAGRYLAALDAMRGEWYTQLFDVGGDGVVREAGERDRVPNDALSSHAASLGATAIGAGLAIDAAPHARGIVRGHPSLVRPVDLAHWEPDYGRLAEAQVKWEAAHGRSLTGESA